MAQSQQDFFSEYIRRYADRIQTPTRPHGDTPAPAPEARRALLEAENAHLKTLVTQYQRDLARLKATREIVVDVMGGGPALADAVLKELIAFAHPDKWPDNPLAHEITVRLNRLREQTK